MKKKIIIATIIILIIVLILGIWQIAVRFQSEKYNLITLDTSTAPQPISEPEVDSFVQLDEINMHYQIWGQGKKPLVLIHGNGGSVNSLNEAARYLSNDYTVYVTESRCHGKSTDAEKTSYSLMAGDIAQFIKAMELSKPYIMGHSDGGMVAIALASEYPDVPGAVISCGSNSHPSKFKPYFTLLVKVQDLFEKSKLNELMLTLPDFNKDYLSHIKCPLYVVAGEYDIMWLSDTVYIHNSIKDSDIAIIKGANHGSYISHDGKQAYILAKSWFSKLN